MSYILLLRWLGAGTSSTYATGRGPAAAACAIYATCRAPTNGDTTTGNKQGVRLRTLCAGNMRIPERAHRTPPSFPMGGPALGDPHATPPWLLPPPPPQRGVERRGSPYRRAFWSCRTRAPRPHVPVRGSRAHSHEPHHEVCLCAFFGVDVLSLLG